jgi:hypothetical protein
MSFAATRGKSSAQTSRLIAPLALVLFGVFALCAIFGYTLARDGDARHQDQRRASLLGVVDEFRNVFANMTADAAADLAADGLTDPADLARARAGRARALPPRARLRGPGRRRGDRVVSRSGTSHRRGHPGDRRIPREPCPSRRHQP